MFGRYYRTFRLHESRTTSLHQMWFDLSVNRLNILRYSTLTSLVYQSKYVFKFCEKTKFWYPFQSILKWWSDDRSIFLWEVLIFLTILLGMATIESKIFDEKKEFSPYFTNHIILVFGILFRGIIKQFNLIYNIIDFHNFHIQVMK